MEKIGLKYGFLTALGLIVYFVVMKLLGFAHILEFRFLNALILTLGIIMALKSLKAINKGNIKYLQGLGTAFLTALVSTTLFAVFMLIYIKGFDDSLVKVLSADRMIGERIESTPGLVVFMVLMLEGVISGFMIGFIAMQYFKRPDHQVPNSP
jgi:hypothetical protein